MKLPLLIGLSSLLLVSCKKENVSKVEYLVNSTSSSLVTYTMVTNTPRQETVSGSWKKTFRLEKGSTVFLSAIHSGLGTTSIKVYADGELLDEKTGQSVGEIIQINQTIP